MKDGYEVKNGAIAKKAPKAPKKLAPKEQAPVTNAPKEEKETSAKTMDITVKGLEKIKSLK